MGFLVLICFDSFPNHHNVGMAEDHEVGNGGIDIVASQFHQLICCWK